jgi:alpha-L-fucosidase
VDLFREAGQRYVVLTAKHHDGFCLFDSAVQPFNVVQGTPFGRDIVGGLAEACRKQDMRFGLYYSQTQDWYHPDGHGNDWDAPPPDKNFQRYLDTLVLPQVEELLTNYGTIDLIWFDTPLIITLAQSRTLLDRVHELQPDCLVNGRIGNGQGDYATTRDNQHLTGSGHRDWECPAAMNGTWGYRESDQAWKSVDELEANLRDVVAHGGNYLLNVGPDGLGRIPEASVERLRALGERLRQEPLVRRQ